jgi:hypothetical protein
MTVNNNEDTDVDYNWCNSADVSKAEDIMFAAFDSLSLWQYVLGSFSNH